MIRPNIRNKSVSLLDSFEEFERSIFNNSIFNEVHNKVTNSFRTDIIDKGESYELKAELPGFQKEEISVKQNGDYLTISAVHTEERSMEAKENYIRRERRSGSYNRCFNVSDIQVDNISAVYKNGILEVKLPKKDASTPNRRDIDIQ